MLPKFPSFKRLELSDKANIEKITNQFPPYSDFNFTSLWCWDTHDQILISELHNNLVVKFTDYQSGEKFYSFLGKNEINETANNLLELSLKEKIDKELKLIPEEVKQNLNPNNFLIKEEPDHFDYIYDTNTLSKMEGKKFKIKRKHSQFFKKKFLPEIKILNLNDSLTKIEVLDLFNNWALDKGENNQLNNNEFIAFSRYLNFSKSINFFAIGLFYNSELIAVSMTENIHDIYNIGHFQKSRILFKGINDYLTNQIAIFLNEKNIKYMNCEQDLGLPGLRENKKSYMPCRYLKKYSVSFVNSNID